MTLEEFALACGVTIVPCDENCWGGPFGYRTKDNSHVTTYGFKNKQEAYRAWMAETFGEVATRAIFKLLKRLEKKTCKEKPARPRFKPTLLRRKASKDSSTEESI